jgi:adenine-specific DNA-methyltransferase
MRGVRQKLPPSGPEREALREKGQFWTPAWVAEAMVGYVTAHADGAIFDPAVGAGAFFRAAQEVSQALGYRIALSGTEIYSGALEEARANGLTASDLSRVEMKDFILDPPAGPFKAIVANPPYIRHHRLPPSTKAALRRLSTQLLHRPLDARAGIHIYFLLRALTLLDKTGRLAFIMPADTCEGVFAPLLWDWITSNYCLDAVVTFEPKATPFPNVDTNPVIFLIKNDRPTSHFFWAKCLRPETPDLRTWTLSRFAQDALSDLQIQTRALSEALRTGLSRAPTRATPGGPILGDFATVLRGIATGSNEFFFLTTQRAAELRLQSEFLKPAVGRTREVPNEEITIDLLQGIDAKGRPTLLFSPDGRPLEAFPAAVRKYLKQGENAGLHRKALIATRRPWYKMEVRVPPPILFAYLGRRNARFILNTAGALPLTGFLCVYPRRNDRRYLNDLWRVLREPETVSNLALVGKSYGDGAIKVEPRALERLPLPPSLLDGTCLRAPSTAAQMELALVNADRG